MIKIRIVVEHIRFADSWLAKLLLKLARWNNYVPHTGRFLSHERWNFRLARKIATYIKVWEENREADRIRKSISPGVHKLFKPVYGNGLDFDGNMYDKLIKLQDNE